MRLLADERCGNRRPFAILQKLAKRLPFGDKGIASVLVVGFALRTLEWKLKEMSREVPRSREAMGVHVVLFPVVGHAYSDRHGLPRTLKLNGYCHHTLVTTDWDRW